MLRNLHLTFDCSTHSQYLGEDFARFCGLLRIYELQQMKNLFVIPLTRRANRLKIYHFTITVPNNSYNFILVYLILKFASSTGLS